MSDSSVENQVKKLVEERKYEEATSLLKSSYNLSDDQAVEFIKKLEQSASSQSKMIKPGIASKLANGCGCFSIVFFLFFVWGVYSMFTSKNYDVEVKGNKTERIHGNYTLVIGNKWEVTIASTTTVTGGGSMKFTAPRIDLN